MEWRCLLLVGVLGLAACATETETPSHSTMPVTSGAPRAQVAARPDGVEAFWPASAPAIHAKTAIMIDAVSGRVIYQKYADTHTQVASTQKLLTALIIATSGGLDQMVTIKSSDTQVEPTKLFVKAGESYTRLNLLSAMLVHSENDAAAALARDHAGSTSLFAIEMNQKAREVGANDSYFVNPHGLPAQQYSTARDMARIAYRVHQNPLLRRIVGTEYYTFTYANGRQTTLTSTNKLLGRSPICTGMKTGYTVAAGKCLVTSGSYGGRDVILVQLGSRVDYIFNDAETMMEWGLRSGSPFGTVY